MALIANKLRLAEHLRVQHSIVLDPEVSLDDVFDPAFWAHTARMLTPRDRIEIWATDNAWLAEVVVTEVRPTAAKVALLYFKKLEAGKAPKGTGDTAIEVRKEGLFYREWVPKEQAYRVVRNSDKEVQQGGLSKTDADALVLKLTEEATTE